MLKIHMPDTALDYLFCKWRFGTIGSDTENGSHYYLKLSTNSGGEQYSIGDGTGLTKSTLDEYLGSLEDISLLSIDICCKELKKYGIEVVTAEVPTNQLRNLFF